MKNNTDFYICVRVQNGFKSQFWSGFNWKMQSIFSHFVRKDTLHLSKTVSGLFGRYDYSILDDKTKIFVTKYFLLN